MNRYLVLLLLTFLISCGTQNKNSEIKELFSFNIGYDSDELGLIFNKSGDNDAQINSFYQNGFYYISDSTNNKILKLTEFGEPILTIYNEENYPIFDKINHDIDEDAIQLKIFKKYPLNDPTKLTSDINKNIYVVNHSPNKKKLLNGLIYSAIIEKFDNKGEHLYTLGQRGIETTPFLNISNMVTLKNGNLTVIEDHVKEYQIYLFDTKGSLLKKVTINNKSIPLTEEEQNYIFEIKKIIPNTFNNNIFITCQFISKEKTALSVTNYKTEYEKTYIYNMNSNKVEQILHKAVLEYFDLKPYKNNPNVKAFYGNIDKTILPIEEVIGSDINSFYIVRKNIPLDSFYNNSYKLKCYELNGRKKNEFNVVFPATAKYIAPFQITEKGMIFTHFIDDGGIQFVKIEKQSAY